MVLRLYAESPSRSGYAVRSGSVTARSAAFAARSWTRVDVTKLLGAGPTLTLTLSDPSPTAIRFAGLKSANPPEVLVIDGKTGAVKAHVAPGGAAAPATLGGLSEQGQLVGGKSAVIAAAGDIACDPTSPSFTKPSGNDCAEIATSNLLLGIPHLAAVLPLGDDQYECGRANAFAASYAPSWGRLKAITHPVPGNHEYGRPCHTNDATPLFQLLRQGGRAVWERLVQLRHRQVAPDRARLRMQLRRRRDCRRRLHHRLGAGTVAACRPARPPQCVHTRLLA